MSETDEPTEDLVDRLCADQRLSWHTQVECRVEDLLERYPELQDDTESLIELIYNEFLLREKHGEKVTVEEYSTRFPQIADQLNRQIELHRALGSCERAIWSSSLSSGDERASAAQTGRKQTGVQVAAHAFSGTERFSVLHRLGSGSMGTVYAAYDNVWRQNVALKVLNRTDDVSAYRLKREFRALEELLHPNLVQFYELFANDDKNFYSHILQGGHTMLARFLLSAIVVASFGSVASAGVISADHPDFGVGSLTRDTDQGLDFLDLTESIGRTLDDVSGQFGVAGDFKGFRYATEDEVIKLIHNFGFSPGAEVAMQVVGDTGGDQLSGLVDLLGLTSTENGGEVRVAAGLFPTSVPGFVGIFNIHDLISPVQNDFVDSTGGLASFQSSPIVGSFLVQDSPVASPVPEPGSMTLFGIGAVILGIGLRRRRNQVT